MKRTQRGIMKCTTWLAYCLSIGYTKSQLKGLERLFWKYKDGNGNLKKAVE